jgi:hypothetical protein
LLLFQKRKNKKRFTSVPKLKMKMKTECKTTTATTINFSTFFAFLFFSSNFSYGKKLDDEIRDLSSHQPVT